MEQIARTKTGIAGFDKLIEGGFPSGSTILLSGSPATGKTILGLNFLYNGAVTFEEPGLYISYEETKENIIKTAKQFDWDFDRLLADKKILIKTFQKEPLVLDTIIADIKRQIKGYGIERIVIDSLTTLNFRRNAEEADREQHLSEETKVKKFIFGLMDGLSEFKDATKIMISEVEGDDERKLASESVSPFLCDGIIFIKYRTMGGAYSRELVVRKMRHTNNKTGFYPMEITKKGIAVKEQGF